VKVENVKNSCCHISLEPLPHSQVRVGWSGKGKYT
jgi:hypothetical protein